MTDTSRIDPDDVYRCCGCLFFDQIEYEKHYAAEHNYLRDTLPSILAELEANPSSAD